MPSMDEITPQTRVADLLDAHPELEDVLVDLAPAFKALRNPVLRRTVAKVATIEKAALRGGMEVTELIHRLQEAAGSVARAMPRPSNPERTAPTAKLPLPDWIGSSRIRETLNADTLLETGRSPLSVSQKAAAGLQSGEMVCLASSFHPSPLMEVLRSQGYRVHNQQNGRHAFMTYIARA